MMMIRWEAKDWCDVRLHKHFKHLKDNVRMIMVSKDDDEKPVSAKQQRRRPDTNKGTKGGAHEIAQLYAPSCVPPHV